MNDINKNKDPKCTRCGLEKSKWNGRWQDPVCETLDMEHRTRYDQHTLHKKEKPNEEDNS